MNIIDEINNLADFGEYIIVGRDNEAICLAKCNRYWYYRDIVKTARRYRWLKRCSKNSDILKICEFALTIDRDVCFTAYKDMLYITTERLRIIIRDISLKTFSWNCYYVENIYSGDLPINRIDKNLKYYTQYYYDRHIKSHINYQWRLYAYKLMYIRELPVIDDIQGLILDIFYAI
jgi:hypothetical protein